MGSLPHTAAPSSPGEQPATSEPEAPDPTPPPADVSNSHSEMPIPAGQEPAQGAGQHARGEGATPELPRPAGVAPSPLQPPSKSPWLTLAETAAGHSTATGAGGAPNSLPDPLTEPRAFLEAVVELVAATDREGYFLFPVDERQAPGYYTVIKSPMCIADMRRKLGEGAYPSFRALSADFELIVSNAKTFNNSKTKCHKCALTLARNVHRILSSHELDMRKAFSVMFPHGAPAAQTTPPVGLARVASSAGRAGFGGGPSTGAGPGGGPAPTTTSDITSTGTPSAHATTPQHGTKACAIPAAAHAADTQTPAGAMGPPAPPSQPRPTIAGARVPSGPATPPQVPALSQILNLGGPWDVQDDAAPDPSPPPALTLEVLMARLRQGAAFHGWAQSTRPAHAVASTRHDVKPLLGPQHPQQPEATLGEGAAGPAPGMETPPPPQPEAAACPDIPAAVTASNATALDAVQRAAWRAARRGVAWQCRWLELRMGELSAQIERLSQGPGRALELSTSPAGSAVAPSGAGAGEAGSSMTVAADLQQRHSRLAAAVARLAGSQPLVPLHPQAALPLQPQGAGAPTAGVTVVELPQPPLTRAAFFAGTQQHAEQPAQTAQAGEAQQPQRGPEGSGTAQDTGQGHGMQPAVSWASLGGFPSAQLPGAVFSSLELLETQLAGVKRSLMAAFPTERGAAGGRARAGAPRSQPSLGGGLAGGPTHSVVSATPGGLLLRKQSSARGLPVSRMPSMAGAPYATKGWGSDTKRKRSDADGDGSLLQPSGSMRYDRAQAPIHIPAHNELPPAELLARQEAVTTWAAAYHAHGPAALSRPPPAVMAALAAGPEEGSSSEDTSDEAYITMHAQMAEEERKRFAAWAAEGQRRRNKQTGGQGGPSKAQAAGGPSTGGACAPGGGHASLQRRQSIAIKAPRPSAAGGGSSQPPAASTLTTPPPPAPQNLSAGTTTLMHGSAAPQPPPAAAPTPPPPLTANNHNHQHDAGAPAPGPSPAMHIPTVAMPPEGATVPVQPAVLVSASLTARCGELLANAPQAFGLTGGNRPPLPPGIQHTHSGGALAAPRPHKRTTGRDAGHLQHHPSPTPTPTTSSIPASSAPPSSHVTSQGGLQAGGGGGQQGTAPHAMDASGEVSGPLDGSQPASEEEDGAAEGQGVNGGNDGFDTATSGEESGGEAAASSPSSSSQGAHEDPSDSSDGGPRQPAHRRDANGRSRQQQGSGRLKAVQLTPPGTSATPVRNGRRRSSAGGVVVTGDGVGDGQQRTRSSLRSSSSKPRGSGGGAHTLRTKAHSMPSTRRGADASQQLRPRR